MSDKTRFRRGEFEGRHRQLPATHRRPIGAIYQRSREDLKLTPLGAPPTDVDVRSVYDVRPINAWDFNIVASAEAVGGAGEVSFSVPEGLVAILRNFDIWFEPNPATAFKSENRWTLQLNGGDFPYNISIPFGTAVDRETVFMIADEFNVVGLSVTLLAETSVTLFARFYGNLLLKSGRPASLEIGNPVFSRSAATSTVNRFRPSERSPKKEPTKTPVIAPVSVVAPSPEIPIKPPFKMRWLRHPNGTLDVMAAITTAPNETRWRRATGAEINQYAAYLSSIRPV